MGKKRKVFTKRFILEFLTLLFFIVIVVYFKDFLNDYSNAMMVVITFVYVVATIEICKANIKSTEAAEAQLAESKRQFKETQRLSVLPFLMVTITDTRFNNNDLPLFDLYLDMPKDEGVDDIAYVNFGLDINNIGSGMANELFVTWSCDSIKKEHRLSRTTILNNQRLSINISIDGSEKQVLTTQQAFLLFRYKDIVGNYYSQKMIIDLSFYPHDQHIRIDGYSIEQPNLLDE